jgi:hypothetical protein
MPCSRRAENRIRSPQIDNRGNLIPSDSVLLDWHGVRSKPCWPIAKKQGFEEPSRLVARPERIKG